MATPSFYPEYHVLKFSTVTEAAAFVAALSRFLNYPQGNQYLVSLSSVEVWHHSLPTQEGIELYLNETAFNAATAAFTQPPIVDIRSGETLLRDCTLVIGGSQIQPWGLDEAYVHLLK